MGYTLDNGNIGYFFKSTNSSIITEMILTNMIISERPKNQAFFENFMK
ncbi:hypothetical protein SAMD00079811_06890 [Scytonema sp. HK-05]|nr:hypothetical protein SAMD00079811_06890 [Scytonema sp. HK-05]